MKTPEYPLYVIPDIHGHAEKLTQALSLIHTDGGPAAPVVFLGDYVDRGPDSAGVLQILSDGLEAGRNWHILRGNHDQMMLEALEWHDPDPQWLVYETGASTTLASYGVTAEQDWRETVPQAHLDVLRATRLWHETDDLILVHAGLRPGISLASQSSNDLMWIRDDFLFDSSDHGRLVVHGHTPVTSPEYHVNRVALDGGAGWGRDLHVAVFEGRDCWLLTHAGRQRLLPPDQGPRMARHF